MRVVTPMALSVAVLWLSVTSPTAKPAVKLVATLVEDSEDRSRGNAVDAVACDESEDEATSEVICEAKGEATGDAWVMLELMPRVMPATNSSHDYSNVQAAQHHRTSYIHLRASLSSLVLGKE